MEKKNLQWSAEETKCLVAIWASTEFQEKLESSTRKSKLYAELVEELAKAGFTRTSDQIINKLKKLKKDYRDTKKDLGKSGAGCGDTCPSFELLDSVMGQRPANQVTGALNSATAATTMDADGDVIRPPATPGSSSYGDELSDTDTNEPSTSRHASTSAASEEREIPDQRQARKRGRKRKRDDFQDAIAYLEQLDEKAEAREERMLQHMQQTTTSLLGLVERMVSAIEGVSNPNQGQN